MPNTTILAAAGLLGVKTVVRVGGAQAVAALAFGTESIPKVDKIVGPGNAFVAEAKMQVALAGHRRHRRDGRGQRGAADRR